MRKEEKIKALQKLAKNIKWSCHSIGCDDCPLSERLWGKTSICDLMTELESEAVKLLKAEIRKLAKLKRKRKRKG